MVALISALDMALEELDSMEAKLDAYHQYIAVRHKICNIIGANLILLPMCVFSTYFICAAYMGCFSVNFASFVFLYKIILNLHLPLKITSKFNYTLPIL